MAVDIIQAQYDQLGTIAGRFGRQAESTARVGSQVQRSMAALQQGGWEGEGAAAFFAEMEDEVLPALGRLSQTLQHSQEVMGQIIAILQQAEEEAAAVFKDTPNVAEWLKNWGGNFDLLNLLYSGNKLFLEFVSLLSSNRGQTLEYMEALGRVINKLAGSRGSVGFMQDLYESFIVKGIPYRGTIENLLRNGMLEKGLVVTDALFGFFQDLSKSTYGGDILKAGGVNTIDSLIQFAITKAHPAGAITMLVNSAVQVGGDLQVGVQRTLADLLATDDNMRTLLRSDAARVDAAADRANLGNITKELSEAIYETYANGIGGVVEVGGAYIDGFKKVLDNPSYQTMIDVSESINEVSQKRMWDILGLSGGVLLSPSGLRNLKEAGVATINVVDGLVDWNVATSTSFGNQAANLTSRLIDSLPISEQTKHAVDEAARQSIKQNQARTDDFINFVNLK